MVRCKLTIFTDFLQGQKSDGTHPVPYSPPRMGSQHMVGAQIFLFIYVFTYFWLCWVFFAAHGISPVAGSRGCSLEAAHRLLMVVASLVAEHGL